MSDDMPTPGTLADVAAGAGGARTGLRRRPVFVTDDDGWGICADCGAPLPTEGIRALEDGEDIEDVIAEDPSWHNHGCPVVAPAGEPSP